MSAYRQASTYGAAARSPTSIMPAEPRCVVRHARSAGDPSLRRLMPAGVDSESDDARAGDRGGQQGVDRPSRTRG